MSTAAPTQWQTLPAPDSPDAWIERAAEVAAILATASAEGLDRVWRTVRTHTLHDPVAYKRREAGRHVLTGELPEPTWYS